MAFIFGGQTGETAESLARKRAIAAQLMASNPAPTDLGSGLTYATGRIAGALIERGARDKQQAGQQAWQQRFNDYLGGMGRAPAPQMAPAQAAAQPGAVTAQPLAQGGLDPKLVQAVIRQESGGNPNAVSPKGAAGIMQIMPATARDPGFGVPSIFDTAVNLGVPAPDQSDATLQGLLRDPRVNQAFGEKYLAAMLNRFGGDRTKALAAYNAGPGAVEQYGGVPPYEETQNYVRAISRSLGGQAPQAMQQPQPQMQGAPTGQQTGLGGIDPRLIALAGDDFAPESMRPIVQALLNAQIERTMPGEQTEFERLAQGLSPEEMQRARMVRLGLAPDADTTLRVGAQQEGTFRQATPEEAAAYGAPGGQFGPDGRFYPINPPSGMTVETGPDGTVRVVQGPGAQAQKPFTEGQSKDVVYATRAEGALATVEQTAGALASFTDRALDMDPTGALRGNFQSPEFQVARAAADEFLQAILRKDTGAAITADEQALYGATYLPRPGDGPDVLAYKKEARRRAIEAIKAGMSPAQMVAQERAVAASRGIGFGTQATPAAPEAPPAGVDPDDWEAMTPEERALFQ